MPRDHIAYHKAKELTPLPCVFEMADICCVCKSLNNNSFITFTLFSACFDNATRYVRYIFKIYRVYSQRRPSTYVVHLRLNALCDL